MLPLCYAAPPPSKARTWYFPLKLSLFEMKAAQSGHVQRGGRELRLGSDVTPNKPRNIGAQIRTQKQKTRSRHQSEAKFRVCECACECVCERVRERERERERERPLIIDKSRSTCLMSKPPQNSFNWLIKNFVGREVSENLEH